MPGKSWQSRRKHSTRSKRKKGRRSPAATVAQQKAIAPAHEAVAPPRVAAPSASVHTSKVTPTTVRYPYIVSELRRIGILAGIMLVILVVLALVLP